MKYLLMYNPKSGKQKFYKKIPMIKEYFKNKNLELDVYESTRPQDLEEKAFEFGKNYDCLIVSGGDGSINEVANGLMKLDKKPKLGIIPSGTANDIAAILGINKNVKKTLDIITETEPVKIDINKLNDRYFIYTTAAGIFTKISYDISRKKLRRMGYFAYLQEGAKELLKEYDIKMTVEHDQGVIEGNFMLALGLSARRVGGMTLTHFSRSKLNDGKLELRLMPYTKTRRIIRLINFILGRGKRSKNDVDLSSSFYKIKVDTDIIWNTDGEKGVEGGVEIKVIKEALEVFASRKKVKEYF